MKFKIIALLMFCLLPVLGISQEAQPVKPKPSEEFMSFIVEKAKLYTEKGEMAISKSVDFAMKEAAPTADQFIKWRIISHIIDALPSLMFFTVSFSSIVLFNFILKKPLWNSEGSNDHPTKFGIVLFISCIFLFISFFGVFINSPSPRGTSAIQDLKLATQAAVAPRIYIIEQVTEFIKDHK